MAEQLLHGLEVARRVEHALAGGVTRLVHALAARRALGDDAGTLEAPVPPLVHPVDAHRLVREPLRARLVAGLSGHQEVCRLDLGVEDVALEVVPERRVRDRDVADVGALREDREALARVVEVLELDRLQRALAQPVVEQQTQRDAIAQLGLAGDDRAALTGREGVVR